MAFDHGSLVFRLKREGRSGSSDEWRFEGPAYTIGPFYPNAMDKMNAIGSHQFWSYENQA